MNDSHHHDISTNLICGYLCIDRAPILFHDRGTAPNSVGPNFNPVFGIARMDSISNLDCMVRNRNMTVVCAFEMDQKI